MQLHGRILELSMFERISTAVFFDDSHGVNSNYLNLRGLNSAEELEECHPFTFGKKRESSLRP